MKRLLVALALSFGASSASAAVWAGANLYTDAVGAEAGFGVLPVPLVGTLGVEGAVLMPYAAPAAIVSVGATLRDVNLPLTSTSAFVGAGLAFTNPVRPYLQGGLRTQLLGPVGLKALARTDLSGHFRAGLGAEVRF